MGNVVSQREAQAKCYQQTEQTPQKQKMNDYDLSCILCLTTPPPKKKRKKKPKGSSSCIFDTFVILERLLYSTTMNTWFSSAGLILQLPAPLSTHLCPVENGNGFAHSEWQLHSTVHTRNLAASVVSIFLVTDIPSPSPANFTFWIFFKYTQVFHLHPNLSGAMCSFFLPGQWAESMKTFGPPAPAPIQLERSFSTCRMNHVLPPLLHPVLDSLTVGFFCSWDRLAPCH